eukprot:437134_1
MAHVVVTTTLILRCLINIIVYALLVMYNVNINKIHLMTWLIWTIYWFNWMENNLVFSWICFSMVGMNISSNELITSFDYGLYVVSVIFIIVCLCISYYVRKYMGKSYDMNDFDIKKNKDHKLCKNGLFSIVRHPMYSICILASFATHLATKLNWISFFFFIGSSVRFLFCIPGEEKVLLNLYGDEFRKYQQKTKCKIIPFVW